ncbi:outer membrane receptor protein involved in Fe transport [Pedobacter sp. CAN_A7]|uniref:TonB-dependent receptor domain-containing protein n=1 Tax=Pedobacter sp. CAN_A7 TaxID=2787722 RepID=UPI0018C9AC56
MKHIAIIFTLLVCFSANVSAQLKERVFSGQVKEHISNLEIPFVTLSMLNTDGKIVASGMADDKGNFSLGTTQNGKLILELNFMSYRKVSQVVETDKNKLDLGTIFMEPDPMVLKEVSITAAKSAVSLTLDKKIFEVGKDILAQSGSVTELLSGVPSVSVTPGGAVSLRGNSSVLVLINGRRSGLITGAALEQLSADQVERVEVIANPSSKYDASGSAGIINIVLKKNKNGGFNGQVRLVAGSPNDTRFTPSLSYKSNKLNLFSTIGLRFSDYVGLYITDQTVNQNGISSKLNQRQDEKRHDDGRLAYFGADYQPDSLNTITIAYLRNATKDHDKTTLTYNYSSAAQDSALVRSGESWERRNYNQLEFNYTRLFKKTNKKLTLDMQYDFWNSAKNWNLSTKSIWPSIQQRPEIRTNSIGSSKDFAAQSDMVIPLDSNSTLEYGLKAENRKVSTNFLAESGTANVWTIMDQIDNEVAYNEFIGSGYVQLRSKTKGFSYQLGLRSEYTEIKIIDKKGIYDSQKDYIRLFPTIHIGYEVAKRTSLQLSYSRRINRPDLNSLYPFNEIPDYNSRYVGNPNLNPSYADVFELGLLKRMGTLTINPSFYYQHNSGMIIDYSYRENELFISMPVNIRLEQRSGAELSMLYNPYKWIQMNLELNAYHFSQAGIYANQDFSYAGNTFTSRFGTQVKLPNKFSVQARYNFSAAVNNAQSHVKSIHGIDMAVGQNLMKDKISLLFDVSNLFNLRSYATTTNGKDFNISQISSPNAARYRLTFVYRLNLSGDQSVRQAKSGNRN